MPKKKTKEEFEKELQETLIQVGLRIAKRGEGALFVVGEVKYKLLVDQDVPPFNVTKNPKLLESLAIMDGAVIIDSDGKMKAYGAMIKSTRTFKNFGTRHSAGISASKKGNLVVIISEEDKKVRVLKEGKMILRKSIYGGFLACNRFPKCRNIAKLPKTTEETPQTEKAK